MTGLDFKAGLLAKMGESITTQRGGCEATESDLLLDDICVKVQFGSAVGGHTLPLVLEGIS